MIATFCGLPMTPTQVFLFMVKEKLQLILPVTIEADRQASPTAGDLWWTNTDFRRWRRPKINLDWYGMGGCFHPRWSTDQDGC